MKSPDNLSSEIYLFIYLTLAFIFMYAKAQNADMIETAFFEYFKTASQIFNLKSTTFIKT